MGYLDYKNKYENEYRILEECMIFTQSMEATIQIQVVKKIRDRE